MYVHNVICKDLTVRTYVREIGKRF